MKQMGKAKTSPVVFGKNSEQYYYELHYNSLMIIPRAEGMLSELAVIVASVASHFLSEPFGFVERGVWRG